MTSPVTAAIDAPSSAALLELGEPLSNSCASIALLACTARELMRAVSPTPRTYFSPLVNVLGALHFITELVQNIECALHKHLVPRVQLHLHVAQRVEEEELRRALHGSGPEPVRALRYT